MIPSILHCTICSHTTAGRPSFPDRISAYDNVETPFISWDLSKLSVIIAVVTRKHADRVYQGRPYNLSIHVLLDSTFFATSVPIADQQRLLLLPPGKGLHVGDTIFLRDEGGDMTWVGDVLAVGEIEGNDAWTSKDTPVNAQRHALIGYLAKIHPGTLPKGTSKLSARWVTLNKRTLPGTLPWWDDSVLVYHSTLRLIEGLLTPDEVQQALERGYLNAHPSGHWVIPHGEARKRILVHILGVELACGLCGGPIASLEETTQDHIIPTSQGGPDALANVQLAHRSCNELKGNALPEQYPPFFPQPGTEAAGWYGRVARRNRNGRGGKDRRGRPTVTAGAFQAEPSGVAAPVAAALDEPASAEAAATSTAADKKAKTSTTKQSPDKSASPAREEHVRAKKHSKQQPKEPEASAADESDVISPEEQAWLEAVQADTLTQLHERAKEANWAARTATLRTIEQLPRASAGSARSKGHVLAEAEGRKGTFRLLDWDGRYVLVEERGRRQTLHLVHMVHAIAPSAYVWYLSRFGRTSPLAVAMALLPLVQKGSPDDEGRLRVSKNGSRFTVTVESDRIVDCAEELSLAAS